MEVKVIPIKQNPKFIIVSKFEKGIVNTWDVYYHYHLNDLSTKNKYSDVGCWHIKYKKPLLI